MNLFKIDVPKYREEIDLLWNAGKTREAIKESITDELFRMC